MHALKLDYRRRDTWRQKAGWAGLLLACVVLAGQGWQYRLLAMDIAADKAELSHLDAHSSRLGAHGKASGSALDAEFGYARDVLLQLDVPWQNLFDAVETSANEEISLLGIEPEPKREQVRIIGEAKNYPAVLEYIRSLEASTPLSSVYLQHHQIQTQDREHPVHFVIGAAWREQP